VLISPVDHFIESMRKLVPIALLSVLTAGCFAPEEMMVQVAPLGEPVPETREQVFYTLPQTVLKVEVAYRETRQVPGPYRDYAERYLGISEVIRNKASRWQLMDVQVEAHEEADPEMMYHINLLQGEWDQLVLKPYLESGLVMDGSEKVRAAIAYPGLEAGVVRDYETYTDLGIESNFAERTETMYKTIVTDTSFVEVPVNRTITEQKSLSRKAQEAADFILELRARRLEVVTGGYDVIPQGEAMAANLKELDKLEHSYLSLFTGKSYSVTRTRSWFVVPESGDERSVYPLGHFSGSLGFVPEDLMEGAPLELVLEPTGKTRNLEGYYSGKSQSANSLIYRLPDVVKLMVRHGDGLLLEKRISIFQSGALVSGPITVSSGL